MTAASFVDRDSGHRRGAVHDQKLRTTRGAGAPSAASEIVAARSATEIAAPSVKVEVNDAEAESEVETPSSESP